MIFYYVLIGSLTWSLCLIRSVIFWMISSAVSVVNSSYYTAEFIGFVKTSSRGTDCKVKEGSEAGTSVTFFKPVSMPP